ncbi:ferritin-like domain-containing protein [Hymenobacter koreensis]|uniref:Ferritin-like domain-containing protein n=1 Tax=Hymenobacter koreensis TaxID=1084523 RepID=A0ABP8IWM7_9BACT
MNFLSFLDALSQADSVSSISRRPTLQQLRRAAAALSPIALSVAATRPAAAQRTGNALDALLLALRLERLQQEFYTRAAASTNLASLNADLQVLKAHQTAHVTKLENILRDSGGTLPAQPNYDFRGGANNPGNAIFAADVFTNPATFLAVAQTLEDFGVRAYKAALPVLANDEALLQLVLRMHSVEARHAAHVRRLRGQKAWVSGLDTGGPVPGKTDRFYEGEDRVKQFVTATTEQDITKLTGYDTADKLPPITESFDEPLTIPAVETLLARFTY